MRFFLDPKRPIHTCDRKSCEGCAVRGKLNCHFHGSQLLKFLLAALPVFAVGVVMIVRVSPWGLGGWLLCFVSYFGLIEIRAMCSHCPHYAEPGTRTLQCWANYGSPRLWKYRPGPMSAKEKAAFFLGMAAVALYPVPFAAAAGSWGLFALYFTLASAGGYLLRRFLCVQCFNFACPFNRVDDATRNEFFRCNPAVDKAWRDERRASGGGK